MFIEIPASKQSIAQRKFVYGVGVNDVEYMASPRANGKRLLCPYYSTWRHMLQRCYANNSLASRPTYAQCTVDPDWHYFSVFREWMEVHDWDGKELDKDIIQPGCQVYSADTCCFVSKRVNTLLCDNDATRGKLPQGVYFDKARGKYMAQVSVNGKSKKIGSYPAVEQAERAYRSAKALVIAVHASRETDDRISAGLWKHAELYKVC